MYKIPLFHDKFWVNFMPYVKFQFVVCDMLVSENRNTYDRLSMVRNFNLINLLLWIGTINMFNLRHLMFQRAWLVRLTSCRDGSFDQSYWIKYMMIYLIVYMLFRFVFWMLLNVTLWPEKLQTCLALSVIGHKYRQWFNYMLK